MSQMKKTTRAGEESSVELAHALAAKFLLMMSKKKMQAAVQLCVELSGRVEGPPQVPSAAKAAADQAVHAGCMARIASAASGITNTVGKHLPCYPDNSNAASPGRRFLCCARPNKAPQREHDVQALELSSIGLRCLER